ncbi:hypothetical protein KI387_031776 [Taxus chinensis]|uniref:Retrotransposon gag domain-containing protein n=1 Tax=Taxus chinensis TaxID=29808 RepID=A0AA38C0J5_TAXCH|nr:hypothetical protein KI387_031776 [Taxus chinensis]
MAGYPNVVPQDVRNRLPKFQGNNAITGDQHLKLFVNMMEDFEIEFEDVYIKLFIHTLEEDARDWYKYFPDNSIDSWTEMKNAFRLQYGDKTDPRFLLSEFENIKKNPNESVHDFNTQFNKTLNRLPVILRPSDVSCLIKYSDAFDKKVAYYLRDKNPTTLRQAFTMALQIENNIKVVGKPPKREGIKLINPEKPQSSKFVDLEEVVKTLAGFVKEISYKLARVEKGIGQGSQGQHKAQGQEIFSNHPRGDHRSDDRGKGPMGSGNRQPQAHENRIVPDPLTARVVVVEEANEIEWCDRCFLPHAPCDEDK